MTLSRREANKERCRKEILKASRRLFQEKGYENTMIEEVAEKANISKATLYNYFPSKDSLLMGTIEEVTNIFQEHVKTSLQDAENSLDKIRRAMAYLIADSIPFLSVSRRILWLDANEESIMYAKSSGVKRIFESMIEEAKEEGLLKKEIATKTIGNLLMGIYLSSQFQWSNMESMTQQECENKVYEIFDLTMAGCRTEKER